MTFGSKYVSGSTGFVFYGFYSKEMLDYLHELIHAGFTYRYLGEETMASMGVLATHNGGTAIVDALIYIPHNGKIREKLGFQIQLQKHTDPGGDPVDAIMKFINPDKATAQQLEEIEAKWRQLVDKEKAAGRVFRNVGKYDTDAADFAEYYTAEDYDNVLYELHASGAILACKDPQMEHAVIRSRQYAIKTKVFKGMTSLKSVVFLDNSPKKIMPRAFQGCVALEQISVLSHTYEVEVEAFSGCISLREVDFSGSPVVWLGECAFKNCAALERIAFTGRALIEAQAFKGCKALREAVFESKIDEIAEDAFSDCTDLTIIANEGTCAHAFAQKHNIAFRKLQK